MNYSLNAAKDHIDQGKRLLAAGDRRNAMQEFYIATGFGTPNIAEAHYELAKLESEAGRWEEALELAKLGLVASRTDQNRSAYCRDLTSLRQRISTVILPRLRARNKARIHGDLNAFIGCFELQPNLADFLRNRIAPSFRLHSKFDPSDSALSKIGGVPRVLPGFNWPHSARSVPLAFIAQICLDDLPASDATQLLPKSGLLLFFYDSEEQPWGDPLGIDFRHESCRVIHILNTDRAAYAKTPTTLSEESRFKACALSISEQLTYPTGLEMSEVDTEIQHHLWNMRVQWYHRPNSDAPVHRLLGHPEFEQVDARAFWPDREDWILLLQVDTDEKAGMNWGDVGMIYFFIQREKLSNCDFGKVRVSLQCS